MSRRARVGHTLEDRVAQTNAGYFLREFSYSRNEFTPPGRSEVELADHIVSVGDLLLVYQVKERTEPSGDGNAEALWFERKVVKRATKQIRTTLELLATQEIRLPNDRGDIVAMPSTLAGVHVAKLVIYSADPALPVRCRNLKIHESATAGWIHVLHASDYAVVLRTLVTLPELFDYLRFREELCGSFPVETSTAPEEALLGQFLEGDGPRPPTALDALRPVALVDDNDSFDVSSLLHRWRERTYRTESHNSDVPNERMYYELLKVLVRLPRTDLREFKLRFMWAWRVCGQDVEEPSVFVASTGCAFVFIPLPTGIPPENALWNLTTAGKYDTRTDECLGIVFRRDGPGCLTDSMLISGAWAYDADIEERLKASYPFRSRSARTVARYSFHW